MIGRMIGRLRRVRWWPDSLRFRLLAGAAVWITLALTIAGFVLSGLFQDRIHQRFQDEMLNHLEQLAASLELDDQGQLSLRQPLSDPRFRRPLSGLYWQIGGPGETILSSRSLWDSVLALPADSVEPSALHRHIVSGPAGQMLSVMERSVVLPERPDAPIRIAIAADRAEMGRVMDSFNRTLTLSLGALALALIAAAVIQVQIGLRPLSRLRSGLNAVRAGRQKRFTEAMPSEIMPLVDDLNALLAHAEDSVGRGRLQAGNLAHALKTNLAMLANEARLLDSQNGQDGPGRIGAAMVERVEVMRRHIDHHMARARAAASRGIPGLSAPVADRVAALARVMRKLHADRALEIVADSAADHSFAGEREDLDEMLGNLVDNACAWARRRVAVASRLDDAPGWLILTVDDDGPGLPADRREAVLMPGVRLDESVPGTGLGLTVVHDLARLYGGDLTLEDSPLGGLRARLRLPMARDGG
jgi:signal transduction histidine kinase